MDLMKLVADMNEAFGNPKGDPLAIDGKKLLRQCKNIGAEFIELMKPFGVSVAMEFNETQDRTEDPETDIRDALCDIMVFALGAYHFMGYDANEDMQEVVDALYTRFCKDDHQLLSTISKYQSAGIHVYHQGEFPRVAVKSAVDQQMPEYPKGKFLKAVGYRTPVFKKAKAPMKEITAEEADAMMRKFAQDRNERIAREANLRTQINDRVARFRAELEEQAFGLQAYDESKNQNTVPGGPQEEELRKAFERNDL